MTALALVVLIVVIAAAAIGLACGQARLSGQVSALQHQRSAGGGIGVLGAVLAAGVGAVIVGAAMVVSATIVGLAIIVGATIIGMSVLGGLVLADQLHRRQERAIDAQFARWLAPRAPLVYGPPQLSDGCSRCADDVVATLRSRSRQVLR
jgi:hypothetical protein